MVYSVVGIRIGPGMRHSWRTVRAGDGTIRRNGIKSLCAAAAQGVKPAQSRWMSMIGGWTGTDALHAVMLQVPMRRAGNNGGDCPISAAPCHQTRSNVGDTRWSVLGARRNETHPMRCSVMFGDDSRATAPLNRHPSCGPPGAIAALVCKTFRSCLEPDGLRGCSSINHIGTGSRRASNDRRLADGACRPHTPSNITLRQPVRRACQHDTAASRPGPEWPGRTTD
ncbi:hypothetical protein XocBAI15_00535 [Xanthomonas oryzae pv. oryzicola]|nr:hypothetical protein XocBAI15_00535 [Xanthomonas oryzae pv. oryzicola]